MQDFKEPKPKLIVIAVCQIILPFWLRFKEHLSIKIRGEQSDLDAFSNSKRAVVLLNHPDRQDPFVVFALANKMHEQFYCIAARECFDWDGGWRGRLFQGLGCYSVERGRADFHSIATTEKLLREGRRKLVVFPEAEITADDSKIHDLHKAIFHIILDVQKELSKKASTDAANSVKVIPVAIRFSLEGDLLAAVAPALLNMEKRLSLTPKERTDVFSRINAVVEAYLHLVFESYAVEKPQASLEQLAEIASVGILQKIEHSIGASCEDTISPSERLYLVRNKAANNLRDVSIASLPQPFHCAGIAKPCIASDFERIERLLILQRMLSHPFSDIQCCRMLDFIESELFGAITPKGRQSSVVTIGTPIDVSLFEALYAQSHEKGVNGLSEHFRQKLEKLLLSAL